MEPRLILIHLLLKLGVATAVSSPLVRSKEFKNLLFREERTARQKVYLVLWYRAADHDRSMDPALGQELSLAGDLSFETALLLGVIGGRWAGSVGGALVAFPTLFYGEWAAVPFCALCGFIAGQLRTMALDKDDIWFFSPFIDLSIYRLIRRNLPRPRLFDWQIMFFITIVALRFVQTELVRYFPRSIFALESPDNIWVEIAIYAASIIAIGIELKIFNSVRIQIKAGGTGAPAAARAHGGVAEPDQSAFSVQHAEFDFVAGALRSRHGARSNLEAGDDSAASA